MHYPMLEPHPKSALPALQYLYVGVTARTLQFNSILIADASHDAIS
jgi:hypothetical protein